MTYGDLRHGHTFQQLCDIRGYMDALMDLTDGEEAVQQLLEQLCQFNLAQIHHFLKADVDMVRIPEDLGMQNGPMISPQLFRQYIKPLYQRMLSPVRASGKIIHMHSDGDIRTLVDDIIDGGVDIINLQDCVNGVEWIGGKFRGKTCVDLDIDRQNITRFGTPKDIDEHIRRCVETVGCPEGGLMMIYGLYPDIPMENVRAVMDAMTRYAGFYR
jgi:uroporphyrinogen decarboxylase